MDDHERHLLFPGLWGALWLVLAGFVCELGASMLVQNLWPGSGLIERAILARVLGAAALFSGVMAYKHLDYASLFHAGASSVRATVGLTLVPALLMAPGLVVVGAGMADVLTRLFPLSEWEQQWFTQMDTPSAAALLLGCAVAPVLEEMLYRGIILRSFLRRYPPRLAILHSAAIFGLAHMNIYQFFVALMLGLVLGWLYERTRSLWPCIALHAGYNACVTLASQADASSPARIVVLSVSAVAVACLAASGLRRMLGAPGSG